MHFLTMIGLVLGAGVIVTDRYIHKLPNWVAVVLYTSAVVMILVGMILIRRTGGA